MLTTATQTPQSRTANDFQNETLPSDMEIAARVLEIRQGWDLNERINRRDEAEKRLSDLLIRLAEAVAA